MITRSFRHAATAGVMAIAAAAFAAPASAITISADNFDRANNTTVGNGWAEANVNANDVAIANNRLRLRDNLGTPDAAVRKSGFSTTGLTNITVTLDWRSLVPNVATDTLNIAWAIGDPGTFDPASWTTVGTVGGLRAPFVLGQSFALGAAAAEQAAISVMLWSDVSAGIAGDTAGFVIDNFVLSGDAITVISLPGTMLLLLSGLGGMAAVGRVRKTT